MKRENKSGDTNVVASAALVLEGGHRRRSLKQILPFMGPAFIASIAYIDPGNFATNIQGGAEFGYTLLWVVVASNLMAMLLQTLSAKLGIASGTNLAEHCRNQFSPPVVWVMWGVMEVVSMATDLAEFLGAALGFYLLFGVPLWIAAILTAIITLFILGLEAYGFRALEAVITAMVGVIAVCYLIETWLVHPDWAKVAWHAVVPQFAGGESVFLATGILGATIMPHVIFLHSSLTQGRIVTLDAERRRRLYRFEILDVAIAMGVAGLINAAMLIMAAASFYRAGLTHIASIEDAYRTLEPLLGSAARTVFAISLLASGLASASVGTMAGQVIM
jgi:manganese transport protein